VSAGRQMIKVSGLWVLGGHRIRITERQPNPAGHWILVHHSLGLDVNREGVAVRWSGNDESKFHLEIVAPKRAMPDMGSPGMVMIVFAFWFVGVHHTFRGHT